MNLNTERVAREETFNEIVRKMKFDIESLKRACDLEDSDEVEMDDEYFYLKSMLFSACPSYIRFPRELYLTKPGQVTELFAGHMDFCDAARARLSGYIEGLDHCVINLFYGQFLPKKRNGAAEIFDAEMGPDGDQVVIFIEWPAGMAPSYDTEHLIRALDASHFYRAKTKTSEYTCGGCGYDIMAIPMHRMGDDFRCAAQVGYDAYREAIIDNWREFDLRRDYYRCKMSKIKLSHSDKLEIKLDYAEDYVRIVTTDSKTTQELFHQDETELGRFWYDAKGMATLLRLSMELSLPGALANLLSMDL